MPEPTLQDLLAPETADQAKQVLLAALSGVSPPFPVTDWQEGGVARTLVELLAQARSDASVQRSAIAAGGFIGLALGDWLTLLASELYDLTRNPATFSRGTVRLASAASAPPYTIVPGQLVAQSSSGLRFSNTTGGTLAAGGTLDLTWQAESPGAAYNVGVGSITTLATPLPGVTINNPDLGGGTWITALGADAETDTGLRARCRARWPDLGVAPNSSVFDLWARSTEAVDPNPVTRTRVIADASLPGQVDVYLAGEGGAVGSTVVAAVQAYIDPRVPLPSTCMVSDCQNQAIQIVATLYIRNGQQDTALAAANANLEAYFETIDIDGSVYESDVIAALQAPTGVRNVELSVLGFDRLHGAADLDMSTLGGTPHVATIAATITVVVV